MPGLNVKIGTEAGKWQTCDLLRGLEAYLCDYNTGSYHWIEDCDVQSKPEFGISHLSTKNIGNVMIDVHGQAINRSFKIDYAHGKIDAKMPICGWQKFCRLEDAVGPDGVVKIELVLVNKIDI